MKPIFKNIIGGALAAFVLLLVAAAGIFVWRQLLPNDAKEEMARIVDKTDATTETKRAEKVNELKLEEVAAKLAAAEASIKRTEKNLQNTNVEKTEVEEDLKKANQKIRSLNESNKTLTAKVEELEAVKVSDIGLKSNLQFATSAKEAAQKVADDAEKKLVEVREQLQLAKDQIVALKAAPAPVVALPTVQQPVVIPAVSQPPVSVPATFASGNAAGLDYHIQGLSRTGKKGDLELANALVRLKSGIPFQSLSQTEQVQVRLFYGKTIANKAGQTSSELVALGVPR